MGRYKVKLEQTVHGNWCATLYEDPVGKPLRDTGQWEIAPTREKALERINAVRDALDSPSEPEWVTLDEVPEPQSLRAV